jgi:hypothetical protein
MMHFRWNPIRPTDAELSEELEAHLRMAISEKVERGESPDPFPGRTEFPLMSIACTLAPTRDRASHLWMPSKTSSNEDQGASLALGKIPSGVDPCVETGKMETVYGSLLMTVQQQG